MIRITKYGSFWKYAFDLDEAVSLTGLTYTSVENALDKGTKVCNYNFYDSSDVQCKCPVDYQKLWVAILPYQNSVRVVVLWIATHGGVVYGTFNQLCIDVCLSQRIVRYALSVAVEQNIVFVSKQRKGNAYALKQCCVRIGKPLNAV